MTQIEVVRGFRVVAELATGGEALVGLADTRAEAVGVARRQVEKLPGGTVRLRLEWWAGGPTAGQWVWQRTGRGELPLRQRQVRRDRRRSVVMA